MKRPEIGGLFKIHVEKHHGNGSNIETRKHLTVAAKLNRDTWELKEYDSSHIICKIHEIVIGDRILANIECFEIDS